MRTILRGRGAAAGYTLVEVIIAVIVFGVLLVPLMRSFALIPRVSHSLGTQSRREAWRSAADQVVAAGVDPRKALLLVSFLPAPTADEISGLPVTEVTHSPDGQDRVAVRVTWLSNHHPGAIEERATSAGIEVGASNRPAPPRQDPLPPLPPRKLEPPVIRAPASPMVRLDELRAGSDAGAPWLATIVAEGSDRVRLRQRSPAVRDASGAGRAGLDVDTLQLAHAVRGEAWTEYNGNPETDIAIPLEGNRTRWLVRHGRQYGLVEPSDARSFEFGLDLGRPVFVYGGRAYPSGERVNVDRAGALRVERREDRAAIDYSEEAQRVFGREWSSVQPLFRWSVGGWPGDSSSGDTRTAFSTGALKRWVEEQPLHAEPQSHLAGLSLLGGRWNLVRHRAVLGPPERAGDHYEAGLDAPGEIDFIAPVRGDEGRVGRPEVGGVESVTESLSVILVP